MADLDGLFDCAQAPEIPDMATLHSFIIDMTF